MKESGIYIHIPYCKNKCIYCDFFSGGYVHADWNLLVDSLLGELYERKHELVTMPDTLYIGGGTPSLMPPDILGRLTEGVVDILCKKTDWTEFTIELNPDDVDDAKCVVWKSLGINRVSLGVQSFVDSELKNIRRRHNADDAEEACLILKKYFDNVSIDMMFGLPGQTLESWRYSVRKCLALGLNHVSAYALMFEEGTPINILKQHGRLRCPSDEECVEMWNILSHSLNNAGYIQYEISNYSKPGFESVHNTKYWLGNPYLGLGPSAHSYDGLRTRRANPLDLKGYYQRFFNGNKSERHFYTEEILGIDELKEEMLLTRMRMRRGLDLDEFQQCFGEQEVKHLLKNARCYVNNGLAVVANGKLKLTDAGIMVSDEVIVGLMM